MDRLFVADKPPHLSSNHFLGRLKRKYGVKKAGFSGTLDPFACGCLIVAFGRYTKLFNHIKKTPKTYRATIWLGAESASWDLENMIGIETLPPVAETKLRAAIEGLQGEFEYIAPKYSAKRINGQRAYKLAREDLDFTPPTLTSTIHEIKMLHYVHPFVTFEATVSEGTYIRSLCEAVANKLEVKATLSYLRRLREGAFAFEGEKAINPLEVLEMEENSYEDPEALRLGKKLDPTLLKNQKEGRYFIQSSSEFAIIQVDKNKIQYLLNKVPLC